LLFRLESPIHAPRISVFGGLPPKFRGNSFRPQQCTSLHDFTSFELSHVKIHPRVWPVGIREPEKKGINKNIICYDTHLSKSPQWVDLYQIWCRGSTGGRNQLCWLFCWSGHRQGYRVCGGGVELKVAVDTELPFGLWGATQMNIIIIIIIISLLRTHVRRPCLHSSLRTSQWNTQELYCVIL